MHDQWTVALVSVAIFVAGAVGYWIRGREEQSRARYPDVDETENGVGRII